MLDNYILDQTRFDWPEILKSWSWLIPAEFTVWIVNRFGDLFIVLEDGQVFQLRMDDGKFERLAASKDEFCTKIDKNGNASEWLYIPLVDELVAEEINLTDSQCYGFVQYPVVGGDYVAKNVKPISVAEYISFMGEFYEKIKDFPDGANVELKITP